jgi:hypothetical protein
MNIDLKELFEEAKNLFKVLDQKSQILRDLENELQKNHFNFSFTYSISTERSIEWSNSADDKKNWRLWAITSKDRKPLIELPLNERLCFINHLNDFMQKFTEYLKEKRQEIEGPQDDLPY